MNIKLTLGERLKDLRVERNLKLETLAEQTGLSKSALSKYESDDVTDLSIYAVTTLAEFYGVTTNYLLGVTENKKRPDAVLSDLHLSDGAGRNAAAAGRKTYTIGSSASLRWVAKTVNCHAHPRILLPQNRCLPEPLTAPFPRQLEPRCNILDFASKVVCQRAFRRSLDSSRQGTGKWGALMKTVDGTHSQTPKGVLL